MDPSTLFGLLGALLVLAFVANRLFDRTRVPDVIVLMVAGLLLGPILGWVQAEELRGLTRVFGLLAIILILFEGGLELNLRKTLKHSPGGLLFAFLVYSLSFAVTAVLARWTLHLSLTSALLVGAVLGCTSIAIILPVLQQMQAREPLKVTLLFEASLGEVFAVLTVGILLDLPAHGQSVLRSIFREFLSEIAVALLLALLVGFVWSRLLPKLSKQPFWQVLTFSVVLLLYAGTEAVEASGLIAVFGFGLTLANFTTVGQPLVEATFGLAAPGEEPHLQILAFHSELAFLVRTFFFVLIGVIVDLAGLVDYVLPAIAIVGGLFLARLAAVHASRWAWQEVKPLESELALWMLPRGLITAVLAIQVVEKRGELFSFLPALAFAVILMTCLVVVYATFRIRTREAADDVSESPAPSANPKS